jgi:dolichyl-phosphate-mannose--protein O-mannosyl transferase
MYLHTTIVTVVAVFNYLKINRMILYDIFLIAFMTYIMYTYERLDIKNLKLIAYTI